MNEPGKAAGGFIPPPPDLPAPEIAPVSESLEKIIEPAVGWHAPSPEKKDEPPPDDTNAWLEPDANTNEWIVGMMRDAFLYPWRKSGWAILVPGAGLALLLTVGAFAPFIGLAATVFGVGYFAAYYFDIIGTTIGGKDAPPEWPELSNYMDDIARPALQMAVVFTLSFLPSIWYALSQGAAHREDLPAQLLYLAGALYFPMGCIALGMSGTIITALPHHVVPAIKRCLPGYLVPMVFLFVIKVLSQVLHGLLFAAPAFVSVALGWLLWFYLLMIQARITGLTCRRFRDRINWG